MAQNAHTSSSYHSTPMEVDELDDENEYTNIQSPKVLLKKLNPQHKNRLFHQVMYTKDEIHLAGALISEYTINKDHFFEDLIQLFIDISAYQYIDIKNYVKHNELKDIVTYMENTRNSILLKTGKYFVKMRKNAKKCLKIGEFLQCFVLLSAKARILYDISSIGILFDVVEKMSESQLLAIKHTGVFLALQLQTGLVRVSYMIAQKIESYQNQFHDVSNPHSKQILEYKIEKFAAFNEKVNKLIDFLYLKIFKKNWNHGDSQLHFMRYDCIMEISRWIDIFPERFLFNNCIDFLIKSITDNHSMVRLNAIALLSNILRDYHLKMRRKKIDNIIVEIGKRMNDVNYRVAIKAVETLTFFHKFIKLPHTIRNDMCRLIYYPHYPLAAAAGKFLIHRINEHLTDPNKPEDCLKMLVYFEKKSIAKGYVDKLPLVVETIIDAYPVLQDVSVYISILENSDIDDESMTILVDLLTESVYQTFLGTCSLVRPKQVERDVDHEKVKKMTMELAKAMNKLSSLITPLKKLTPLLVIIRDYGMKEFNNNNNETSGVVAGKKGSSNVTVTEAGSSKIAKTTEQTKTSVVVAGKKRSSNVTITEAGSSKIAKVTEQQAETKTKTSTKTPRNKRSTKKKTEK